MKRATAYKSIETIIERLRRCGGLIYTPECEHPAYHFKRVAVFGSCARALARDPSDVDILFDGQRIGNSRHPGLESSPLGIFNRPNSADHDAVGDYVTVASRFWPFVADDAQDRAIMHLRGGLRGIKFHNWSVDSDVARKRILVWPFNSRDDSPWVEARKNIESRIKDRQFDREPRRRILEW